MVGRRLRVKTDGTQIHKIHLKEDDRKNVEHRLEPLALLYKNLTNKIITFEFVKSLAEEKRRKKKKGKEPREPREPKEIKRSEKAPAKAEEAK